MELPGNPAAPFQKLISIAARRTGRPVRRAARIFDGFCWWLRGL